MKNCILVMLALAGSALLAQPAQAQVRFGPQIAWGDDTDLGVGGRVDFGLGDVFGVEEGPFSNLFGSADVTYFFIDDNVCGDDCSYFEANGNLAVPFTFEDSSLEPYAGAGVHIGRFSDDVNDETEVGLNLLGGLLFPLSDLTGFVQGKFGLAGVEQFVLSAGVLF